MSKTVLIIGGGHNGLVCAAYLARAGMKVTVVERRGVLGGAAVTEEFLPGFRNSLASYTVSLLHPAIIKDLNLYRHGLRILPRRVNNYLPLPDGNAFIAYPDNERMLAEIRRFSKTDVVGYREFTLSLEAVLPVIRDLLLRTPPRLHETGLSDLWQLFSMSKQFTHLTLQQKQFLVSLFSRSAGEILEDYLEGGPLRALLGFDAIVGNFASPYNPGSGYVMLHHVMGEINGNPGQWGHAVGGMGSISDAIAREAEQSGVAFLTGSEVNQVIVDNNSARGISLQSGGEMFADIVVANVTPPVLFLKLLPPDSLDPVYLEHFSRYRCQSGSFRMNVALGELPRFTTMTADHCLEAGIIIAPDLDYMDKAYHEAKEHGWSRQPVVEMLIPSIIDDSLAPPGRHVASLFCQHFDPGLRSDWMQHRDTAADTIIDTVNAYAPNFRASIIGRRILSPWDLEQELGLTGGDIFHGRLSLEQLFSSRPHLGLSQYAAPIENLYMCGSGTHPGGGVSGIPGHNAAREILRRHH